MSFCSAAALWLLLIMLGSVLACDGPQRVSVTAEDFRFVPDRAVVSSTAPLTLSIYNAGREVHEFDSPVLVYAAPAPAGSGKGNGLLLKPGQSLALTMAPPAGTYLYICRRKGHGDMTGTLIVE